MLERFRCLILLVIVGVAFEIKADSDCRSDGAPKLLYDLLKCVPRYDSSNKCIQEYTCPFVDRPGNTCHFKGQNLQVGEYLKNEDLREIHRRDCVCSENLDFQCPHLTDGCAESWVGGIPRPGCYLKRRLGQQCAVGQICPPYGTLECSANGKIYREAESFQNPDNHCSVCICEEGLGNNYVAPFCQTQNCTWTMFADGPNMDKFCAPFYRNLKNACCPDEWICPSATDDLQQNPSTSGDSKCRFGDRTLGTGDYIRQNHKDLGKVKCECTLPPLLQCALD